MVTKSGGRTTSSTAAGTVVGLEDKFIDLAFEAGEVQGMTPTDIKSYIRFIADWRLRQLELPALYGVKENPLPWLQSMLSGVEHANFFEARATEYSKRRHPRPMAGRRMRLELVRPDDEQAVGEPAPGGVGLSHITLGVMLIGG